MLAMQRVHQSYLRVLLAVSVFYDAAGLHFRQAEDLRQKRVSTVPRDRLFKHLPVKVHDPSVWLDCSRANVFDVGVFFRESNRDVTFLFCAFHRENLDTYVFLLKISVEVRSLCIDMSAPVENHRVRSWAGRIVS